MSNSEELTERTSNPNFLKPGQKVGSGRFTLTRRLGKGGMGVVWLAHDEELGDEVALKFPPPELAADTGALHDLRRETQKSRRLTHTNIIRIHDFFIAAGEYAFICMEFVDGKDLQKIRETQEQGVFTWHYLEPLVRQLCSALDYAHGENVIHRDLKPSNLMLTAKGRLKLADFGIAATVSDTLKRVSVQHATSGTPVYMSPQQMRGDRPNATDDIYSLGATIYDLLCSRPPFYRGDIGLQVREVPPQPLPERFKEFELTSEVPPAVNDLILACLAKDAAHRPQNALEVLRRLDAIASGRSGTATPAPATATALDREATIPGPPPTSKTSTSIRPAEPEPPEAEAEPEPEVHTPPPRVTPARKAAAPTPIPARKAPTNHPPAAPPPPPPEPEPPPPSPPEPARKSDRFPALKKAQQQEETKKLASQKFKTRLLWGFIFLLICGGLLAYGVKYFNQPGKQTAQIPKPPPVTPGGTGGNGGTTVTPVLAALVITVTPPEAEIATNGTQLGRQNYPLEMTGVAGGQVSLVAHLDGYFDTTESLVFPGAGLSTSKDIVLKPKPALLTVWSDPPGQISILDENKNPVAAKPTPDGFEISPGIAFEVSVKVNGYDTVSRRVRALKPGEHFPAVDFGKLTAQAASLRVAVEPANSRLTVIYPGRDPMPLGSERNIPGITPKVPFYVVAEHEGYYAASNQFTLGPAETKDFNFGRLKPMNGSLTVSATPQPFHLRVEWDGKGRDFPGDEATDLPPEKELMVIVSAGGHEPMATNVTLLPGQARRLDFGRLPIIEVTLYLKVRPAGANVAYTLDNLTPVSLGAADQIDKLPVGHSVGVTLSKPGFYPKTMTLSKLQVSGNLLDFGQLVPAKLSLLVEGPNAGADVYVDGNYTGVKSGGALPNMDPGHSYTIKLHKAGFTDVSKTVTINSDGAEQKISFDAMAAIPPPPPPVVPVVVVPTSTPTVTPPVTQPTPKPTPPARNIAAEVKELLRQINANIITVQNSLPLTESSKRSWLKWISDVEATYKNDPQILSGISYALDRLREVVNTPPPNLPRPRANNPDGV